MIVYLRIFIFYVYISHIESNEHNTAAKPSGCRPMMQMQTCDPDADQSFDTVHQKYLC